MLSASATLKTALESSDSLNAKVKVIAEWNHNRYTEIAEVDNFNRPEKTYGYDLDTFPIESITDPVRPTAGIAFAKAGEAYATSGYSSNPSPRRFYTSSPDSKYKNWTSPEQSNGSKAIANASPYVKYATDAWTNKIYLCFENSWSAPSAYTVMITTDGTNWTTVYTGTGTQADGTVELYLQGDNSWNTTPYFKTAMKIRGVRVNVTQMNRANSYLNVIEMGARLVNDLSDYVISYEVNNEMSDADQISPIGLASSNTGSITLSNLDGRFTNDNSSSLYYGLIDANVKFTIDLGIDTSAGTEWTRLATMFTDQWGSNLEESNPELKDASKYLQEVQPLSLMMEGYTVGKAIWTMLDSVGFNAWNYSQIADSSDTVVPYFWTDTEKTVWENIQGLAKATQTAIYFDQFGVLQIKTKKSAFDKTQSVQWTLDYAQRGSKLPDIIELTRDGSYEANKVTINYRPTSLAVDAQKRPISEIVWQPDDDVVVRSSALAKDMNNSQTWFDIDRKDAAYWPFEGMVNIRGELIKYSGKQYGYIDKTTGAFKYVKVTTNDAKLDIDNNQTKDGQQYRNYFTGRFYVTERGVDETNAEAHDSTISGWLNGAYYGSHLTTQKVWNGGLKHIPEDSVLRLQTNKTFTGNHFYCARRMAVTYATPNYFFGTRFKFPSKGAGTFRAAGLFFSASADMRSMYVLDIMTTKDLDARNGRKTRNEIAIIRRDPGKNTYLGRGAVYAIGDDIWYDVDVQCDGPNITVSINGRQVLSVADPAKDLVNTSRQGLMVRGFTVADFEYWYHASANGGWGIGENALDNSSYLDLIKGGYYSAQYYRDYMYGERRVKKRIGKKTVTVKERTAQKLFDEFGMNVHEVRKFDVKFEKPCIYSSLYVSNETQAVVPEYTSNPFGASFYVANAYRTNAVINGEDSTFGPDNTIQQKMMVTGRTIQQNDVKTYEVKDEAAIRARGEIPTTFDSDWIQSEGAAKELGNWISDNWSEPADEVEANVFGNPLYQIGDLVAVNYSPLNMTSSTHKYFVLAVKHSWDDGPETTLSLRRARI